MNKIYTRKIPYTLTNIVIDKDNNIVKGINDIGCVVIMTLKQFNDLYEES